MRIRRIPGWPPGTAGRSPVARPVLACGQRRHHWPSWTKSLVASLRPCPFIGCFPMTHKPGPTRAVHSLLLDAGGGAGMMQWEDAIAEAGESHLRPRPAPGRDPGRKPHQWPRCARGGGGERAQRGGELRGHRYPRRRQGLPSVEPAIDFTSPECSPSPWHPPTDHGVAGSSVSR